MPGVSPVSCRHAGDRCAGTVAGGDRRDRPRRRARLGWVTRHDSGCCPSAVLECDAALRVDHQLQRLHAQPFPLLSLTALGLGLGVAQQALAYVLHLRRPRSERRWPVCAGELRRRRVATPYLAGFVGPQAMIYSSLFDIGGAFAGAGVGYAWGMGLAGEPGGGASGKSRTAHPHADPGHLLRAAGAEAARLGRLPDILITFTSTVGAANPFLAMLMIGIGLELRLHPGKYWAAARMLGIRYAWPRWPPWRSGPASRSRLKRAWSW